MGKTIDRIDMGKFSHLSFAWKNWIPERPLLITNACLAQQAADPWSPTALKQTPARSQVRVSFNENGIFDHTQHAPTGPVVQSSMQFNEAVELLFTPAGRHHYMNQISVRQQLPELVPALRWSSLIGPAQVKLAANLWISGADAKTPLHYDVHHNFLTQHWGIKKVRLYPPGQAANLYPSPDAKFPHCSQINVFDSAAHVNYPLYHRAQAECVEFVLEPGHILYIPPRWWHAVETVEPSISINYWWCSVATETMFLSRNAIRRGLLQCRRLVSGSKQ